MDGPRNLGKLAAVFSSTAGVEAMAENLTTRQVADIFGVAPWRIRRLYELNVLSEPPRFGGRRVVSRCDLPHILDALRERKWLPNGDDQAAAQEAANHQKNDRRILPCEGAATADQIGADLHGCYPTQS